MTAGGGALDAARARFGLPPAELAPAERLAGDAGHRRYFRVTPPRSGPVVVVLYPEPGTPPQRRWTELRGALERVGLRVPALHADAPDLGAALIEDLGGRDLADDLAAAPTREERARLLAEAEELLPPLRRLPPEAVLLNPPFDAAFFAAELDHTRLWALEKGGEAPLPPGRRKEWDERAGELARAAADPGPSGALVATHRDFHANNVMRAPDGRLALIDFQDLRLGPADYDPVSLRFERAGEREGADPARYAEAVLLQRAWKVIGTFEKMLALGREVYRPHLAAARRVVRRATRRGGAFEALLGFLPPEGGQG